MELLTARLAIREWGTKDISDLIDGINRLDVSKWLLTVPQPYLQKDAEWWVNHNANLAAENPREEYNLAIELLDEKKVIGGIGLTHVDLFQGTCEIGYWLGENYHRKGFMSEAVQKVLEFAFLELNLRRVNLAAFDGNKASIELAVKFGFVYEGTKRQGVRSLSDSSIHDEKCYGLLREEWLARRQSA